MGAQGAQGKAVGMLGEVASDTGLAGRQQAAPLYLEMFNDPRIAAGGALTPGRLPIVLGVAHH
ncbi:hypothetical protein [Pseudomonas shirazensis]|uniref:hypothetical protein n=1 Tax=Pseudomonas shirazensis TaxID=2745494 RepID=UPI0039870923